MASVCPSVCLSVRPPVCHTFSQKQRFSNCWRILNKNYTIYLLCGELENRCFCEKVWRTYRHTDGQTLANFNIDADGVTVTEELSSQTFIYFGNQIFFITHQLSAPLFNLANEYMNTPTETVDLILSQFQDALRRYPQTFLVYKQFDFRINLAHVNKLLAHMTGTKLSPNRLIFS